MSWYERLTVIIMMITFVGTIVSTIIMQIKSFRISLFEIRWSIYTSFEDIVLLSKLLVSNYKEHKKFDFEQCCISLFDFEKNMAGSNNKVIKVKVYNLITKCNQSEMCFFNEKIYSHLYSLSLQISKIQILDNQANSNKQELFCNLSQILEEIELNEIEVLMLNEMKVPLTKKLSYVNKKSK